MDCNCPSQKRRQLSSGKSFPIQEDRLQSVTGTIGIPVGKSGRGSVRQKIGPLYVLHETRTAIDRDDPDSQIISSTTPVVASFTRPEYHISLRIWIESLGQQGLWSHTLTLPDISGNHYSSILCQNNAGFKAASFIRWVLCGIGTTIMSCIQVDACTWLVQRL
jgi:hypothetical protein